MHITLDKLKPRQKAVILKLNGNGALRRRLLEMGLVVGAEVCMKKCAPLADPVEYIVKGYHLSLRKKEAADIQARLI